MINKYITYLKYLIKHKWWVLYYCFKNELYLRGIIHDWSKFTWIEFKYYTEKFGNNIKDGRDSSGYYDPTIDINFQKAWHHHTRYNKHHWQYWVLPKDDGAYLLLDMNKDDIKEMICDWLGAGRAQGNISDDRHISWYILNRDKIHISEVSRNMLEYYLNNIKV